MSLTTYHKLRKFLFIVVTVAASSSISLIGGLGIESVQEKILPLIPLIVALPALNTMVGDYAAIIAAHAIDPADTRRARKELLRALGKAIWVNIIGVLALSLIIAQRRGYLFENIFLLKFALFIVGAMLGIIFLMFSTTLLLDKILERRNLHPDDILIPVVTSITDVLMLGLIALASIFLF